MRLLLALLMAPTIAAAGGSPSPSPPCAGLDDEAKKAFYYLIDSAYNVGKIRSEDPEEILWANKTLISKGKAVLPCLLDVYSHGVRGGLWHGEGPEPTSGRWALGLIRSIDGPSAIPLYRELYTGAADPITRAFFASELLALGDLTHATEVVSFLNAPPQQTTEGGTSVGRVRQQALAAIAAQNYRPALPTLKKLAEDDTVPDQHRLALYIAQLSGDLAAVKAAVGDPRLRDTALLGLKRMGKPEVLRQIAEDKTDPAREAAKLALQGRLDG